INGLTIKRGYITGDSARGGGIYCTASSPTIKNCIIANNQAIAGWDDYAYGAGISCINGSSPTIKSCHIVDNYAEGGPGGSGGYDGFPGAGAQGGGIYSTDDLVIENCVIRNNTAKGGDGGDGYGDQQYYGRGGDGGDAYGAGISTTGSSSILFNNLIIGNSAIGGDGGSSYMVPDGLEGSAYGGAIYGSDFLVTNCTISDNSSEGLSGAGGISGTGTVTNCILWGNGDDLHGCSATYSCIEDGDAGTGNISTDPDFVSGPLGDYYLSQTAAGQPTTSPCVNTGSDTAANLNMDILTTRTDQILDSGTVDMGYHYSLLESPDINFDGDVDLDDFAILASQWRQPPGTPSADIEPPGGDGVVDEFDLAILTDYWLWGVVVPNSLVSHWKFDETSGATAYDSAGTNHGILANGTVWTTGQIDGALYFDGSDDYVSVPDSLELNITGDITISAWVNFTAGGSEQAIVTKTVSNGAINNPFDFRTSSAAEPTLRFVRADASGAEIVFSTEPIPIQSWHHVAIRIENNVADFYVDGDITGKTGGLTKPATGNSNPLLIGKRDDGWPFNGKIDDVRIYNYALSAEEILSLYQQGSE
ncbi:MAG: hypothetical protein KAS75_00130, partial [Planctomycetes bacterium]|nr:hypothetical protein [Planctomycetota bacterium]